MGPPEHPGFCGALCTCAPMCLAVRKHTWVLNADTAQMKLVQLVYGLHECGWNIINLWAHADVVLLAGISLVVECSHSLVKGIAHHMNTYAICIRRPTSLAKGRQEWVPLQKELTPRRQECSRGRIVGYLS